jgi:hypothetical protein
MAPDKHLGPVHGELPGISNTPHLGIIMLIRGEYSGGELQPS